MIGDALLESPRLSRGFGARVTPPSRASARQASPAKSAGSLFDEAGVRSFMAIQRHFQHWCKC